MSFPLQNIIELVLLRPEGAVDAGTRPVRRINPVAELTLRYLRQSTYVLLAVGTYLFHCPLDQAAELRPGWIVGVLARNLVIGLLLYHTWHWFLYDSPWGTRKGPVGSKKYNPVDQYSSEAYAAQLAGGKPRGVVASMSNLTRERVFTSLGLLISGLYEVLMLHLWASGRIRVYTDFWAFPVYSVAHLAVVMYWRDFHFFFAHRVMHPWKVKLFGVDPGRLLYKHVHKLHHRSHNCGPMSGLSMHPIEHIVYYSCTLTPLLFQLHPVHFLYNKYHADLSPIAGHDGHDKPGGGALFHFLHHSLFEVNYGTPMVPLDRLFGTYEDGSRFAKPPVAASQDGTSPAEKDD